LCLSFRGAQPIPALKKLTGPLSIHDLSTIADAFADSIETLEIFLPPVDKASIDIGSQLLRAVPRFPNLRKLSTHGRLKYSKHDLLQSLLQLNKLEEIAIGVPHDISADVRRKLHGLPNLTSLR
jgi:hypothetical protein